MAGSIERVNKAAADAGLTIDIRRMGASTRTADDAARECGCSVAQIVKSLIFEGERSGALYLFLVSGANQLDVAKAAVLTDEPLKRADPKRIREDTGFAIGGVAPIGHQRPISAFADEALTRFEIVWAAAGAHDAVFGAAPAALFRAAKARIATLATD